MWNTANGLKQFYTDSGNKDGIPVIFVHGFPFDHSTWDEQVRIIPSRFRAITYDIRGHGLSEAGSGHYSLEFFVDDLFALMDQLSIVNPVVCGLSMGGYIVLRAFERNPDAFRALILCDTRSEADSNEAKIKRAGAIRTILEKGIPQYAEDSVKNLFWEENVKAGIPAVTQIKQIIEKTSSSALCGTIMALASRTDTTEALEQVKIPEKGKNSKGYN